MSRRVPSAANNDVNLVEGNRSSKGRQQATGKVGRDDMERAREIMRQQRSSKSFRVEDDISFPEFSKPENRTTDKARPLRRSASIKASTGNDQVSDEASPALCGVRHVQLTSYLC
eukprot:1607532-Rhodomonas_salina.1